MKIVRSILILLLLLCGHAVAVEPEQLVGTWRHSDGASTTSEMTFNADHTFSATITVDGKLLGNATGRWLVRGKKLAYQYTWTSIPGLANDAKDLDIILALTTDTLLLHARDGVDRQYNRVSP